MAIIGTMQKQPGENLDYDIDFSDWIPEGDYIASAVVTPITGIAVGVVTVFDDYFVKVWLSGGTSGTTYKLEVTATTNNGRIKQAEFKVKVREY